MTDPISAGLLVLRVALGAVFVAHGVKHALGRAKTSKWFGWLGFRQPGFQWFMSTATEIGVGALLIAGLFTSVAAAGVIGIMFVAFWTVHRAAGFFITAFMKEGIDVEGWEYVATLAAAALALAVAGPGEWSLDDAIGIATDLDGWIGLALGAGGIVAGAGQLLAFWRPSSAGS